MRVVVGEGVVCYVLIYVVICGWYTTSSNKPTLPLGSNIQYVLSSLHVPSLLAGLFCPLQIYFSCVPAFAMCV